MAFKNSIKEIRLKNKLSKVEMAKKLDVSEATIRMWESGKNDEVKIIGRVLASQKLF